MTGLLAHPINKQNGVMMTIPRRLTEDVMLLGNPYFSVYLVQTNDSYTMIECGISSIAEQVIRRILNSKTKAGLQSGR